MSVSNWLAFSYATIFPLLFSTINTRHGHNFNSEEKNYSMSIGIVYKFIYYITIAQNY